MSESGQAVRMNASAKDKVLAVDDEPAVLSLLERLLKTWGYSTAVARSEVECLELWRVHKDEISTAILDLRLGTTDGRNLGALLRNEKPELKIIFMSGYPVEEFKDDTLVAGSNFISKPFGVRELRSLL